MKSVLEMKKALINDCKNRLNKNSKWYNDDVVDFKNNLNKCSDSRIKEMYNNSIVFNSKSFEKFIDKEKEKLLKAGMYNMNNLKSQNSLD